MSDINKPYTAPQVYLTKRAWRLELALAILGLLAVIGLVVVVLAAVLLAKFSGARTPAYANPADRFVHGSIGAEPDSGIPYWLWKTLPSLYPEAFQGRSDYSAFGFLYETGPDGRRSDLPIGVSRRQVQGVDVVWLNCATCHTGTWRTAAGASPHVVPGMPSNNLDFYRFIRFLLDIGADERLTADTAIPAMQKQGARLGPIDQLTWRYIVLPRVREGLIERRTRLLPLLEAQPAWGPGRVDTFNPYKLLLQWPAGARVPDAELVGTADFPAIFDQRPREGMHLHWDGNNTSLAERNLSAAVGAGVTPQTVDHAAIDADAKWLLDLKPPPSPNHPDPAAVERGKATYMQACAACHGWQGPNGYVFQGAKLGQVEPIASVGTDPNRLNSYTQAFRDWQVSDMFKGTPYQFSHFSKTDGYANLPLDGLWLRAPYLHNGSVPTLADLLTAPADRPKRFVRGSDVVDGQKGGFLAPACDAGAPGFCFDTSQRGNGAQGHAWGADLPGDQKKDLLAYLLTF